MHIYVIYTPQDTYINDKIGIAQAKRLVIQGKPDYHISCIFRSRKSQTRKNVCRSMFLGDVGVKGEKGDTGLIGLPGRKGEQGSYGVPGIPGIVSVNN